MTNFRNIIVPETMKCLEVNDPTVLDVLGNFQEIISSCDSSLEDMIQTAHSVAFKKTNVRILRLFSGQFEPYHSFLSLRIPYYISYTPIIHLIGRVVHKFFCK